MENKGSIKKWIVILQDGSEVYAYGDNIQIALLNSPDIVASDIRLMYREDWPRFPLDEGMPC